MTDASAGRVARNERIETESASDPVGVSIRPGKEPTSQAQSALASQDRSALLVAPARYSTNSGVGWDLVYQSRSGPPTSPWLAPDINDAMRDLAARGIKAIIIVPLGFVSDHMEVKWDLDTEAMQTAAELGILALRVPTPGVHAAYVAGLVDLVLERRDGVPVAERPALTALGPWYDVCRAGCCENVRLGFKPALAGVAP